MPVRAAGSFRVNLGTDAAQAPGLSAGDRAALEQAAGVALLGEMASNAAQAEKHAV